MRLCVGTALCLVVLMTGIVATELSYEQDYGSDTLQVHKGKKRCSRCKDKQKSPRSKRDMSTTLADLARDFVNRGGVEGISALMNSDNKMDVLKRIMGQQVTHTVLNGLINRFRGSGQAGSSGGGAGASYSRPAQTGGSGATGPYKPPPAPGASVNPDDTEY